MGSIIALTFFACVTLACAQEPAADHAVKVMGSLDLLNDMLADKLIGCLVNWMPKAMEGGTLGKLRHLNSGTGKMHDPRGIPPTRQGRYAWQNQYRDDDKMLRSRGVYAAVRGGTSVITKAEAAASPAPEIVLYGSQGSRSPLVNWAMYELGVEFSMGDLAQNPHPFGQIPSIQVGDATLFESGAILAYLQNLFGKETEKLKALIISWIVWANASLDPVCFKETPQGKVYDTGLRDPKQRRILKLDEIFSKQQYIVSNEFSLADVAIASYLLYVVQFFPDVQLSQWKHVVAYMKRCAERPAYGKAFGANVQGFLVQKLTQEAAGEPNKKMFGLF